MRWWSSCSPPPTGRSPGCSSAPASGSAVRWRRCRRSRRTRRHGRRTSPVPPGSPSAPGPWSSRSPRSGSPSARSFDEEGRMPRLSRRRVLRIVALGAAVALGVLALPAPASVAALRVMTLSTAYSAPVQVALGGKTVLVAQGNGLFRVGSSTAVALGPRGGDIHGVAFGPGAHSYAYTSSKADHSDTRLTIVQTGQPTVTASLSAFEKANNPDAGITYGVRNASACVRSAFKALDGGPASYKGKVDSHPYAVAPVGHTWYVADAGGNDLLRVDASGAVSRVATLPAQGFTFSARLVSGLGMPSCVVGVRYYAEPVPTDVEVGPDGSLYVTVLPGLYDLGQLGSLYRVNPATGAMTRIATGFAGAANVAVTSTGAIYVAEQLRGTVS